MEIELDREYDFVVNKEDEGVKLGSGLKGSQHGAFNVDSVELERQIFKVGEAPDVLGKDVFIILVLQKAADVVNILELGQV